MAYVLGFLYADGNITDASISSRTQYIQFNSKDKEILEAIKLALSADQPIYYRPPKKFSHRNGVYTSSEQYCLRVGSRRMFADLIKIGLTPRKSKTIGFPENIPNKYLNHFVRGYFDGDGCVYFQITPGEIKESVVKRLNIIFTSGSKTFLKGLSDSLERGIGINKDKIYTSNHAYQLRYFVHDTIKLFKFLYKNVTGNLYLKRKLEVFLKYFQLRPLMADNEVWEIFKNLMWPGVREARKRSAKPFYMGANPIPASQFKRAQVMKW